MSIVGKDAIWDANFTSTKLLEEELSKYLTPEQVIEFMEYLKVKPYNQRINKETGIGEVDNAIDNLLKLENQLKGGK
jgi:hypothetical protein